MRALLVTVLSTLALGCGGAAASVAPASAGPAAPTLAPSEPIAAAAAPIALPIVAEGEAIAWPDEPVASFHESAVALASGVRAVVAEDGKALIALSPDRFVVIPADGTIPVRAYANARGLVACGDDPLAAVAIAGGAFLACAADGTIVALELDTLAVRWERPAPARVQATRSTGDAFVVSTGDGWIALDARTGTTLWERSDLRFRTPRTIRGLVFEQEDDEQLVALDARTGTERFRLDAAHCRAEPLEDLALALLPSESAPRPLELRVAGLDGTVRSALLGGPLAHDTSVLLDGDTVTAVVRPGAHGIVVQRCDLRSGTCTTQSATLDDEGLGITRLEYVGRALLLVDSGLGARLLDGEPMTERWLGEDVGECRPLVVWRPTTRHAPVLACVSDGELGLYLASATPVPRHRVTVSGTIRCDGGADLARVRVEGHMTETDESGRYRIEVMADDDLDVSAYATDVPMDTACSGGRTAPVTPDASEVTLDVDMQWLSFDISGL